MVEVRNLSLEQQFVAALVVMLIVVDRFVAEEVEEVEAAEIVIAADLMSKKMASYLERQEC